MNKKLLSYTTLISLIILFGFLFIISLFRPFISDEFHEAVLVSKLFKLTPYKDFLYYKNVLGYYLKAPLLMLPISWWSKLVLTRVTLFLFFLLHFILFIIKARKFFSPLLLTLSLGLAYLISQSILHTVAYRVDLITMVVCSFALLFTLDRKFLVSGLLLGVAFLISQKAGLYYLPLFGVITVLQPKEFKPFLRVSFGILIPVVIYILFWGFLSDFKTVIYTMFIQDTIMATSAGLSVRWYWLKSLKENTFIYLTSFTGLYPLFWKEQSKELKACLLFTSILFIEAMFLGQPWPHWFILWCPFLAFPLYTIFIHLETKQLEKVIIGVTLLGLIQTTGNLLYRYQFNNEYQKFNLLLLESFLQKGESYLAGVDVHESYDQNPSELREMYAMNRIKVFQSSIDEKKKLVEKFKNSPPHILFYNYRLREFIPEIQALFDEYYYHFWGNIFAYQIRISPGEQFYNVPIDGKFLLSGNELLEIEFRNQKWKRGNSFILKPGPIKIKSNGSATLKLIPKNYKVKLNKDFINPRSLHLTFDSK